MVDDRMRRKSELTGHPVATLVERYVVRTSLLHAKQFNSYLYTMINYIIILICL